MRISALDKEMVKVGQASSADINRPRSDVFSEEGRSLFVLATIALTFACIRFLAGLVVDQPIIFTDELAYWHMARSFFEGHGFMMFGAPLDIPSRLYSVFISPCFALDGVTSYYAAKMINVLLMATAVFPAYGLAREVLPSRESLAVAILSLATPGGVYTATIMAESLFFPLFLASFWFAFRTLDNPKWQNALCAGLAFSLGFYCKPHELFIVTAYLACVITWTYRKLRAKELGAKHVLAGYLPLCIFVITLLPRLFSNGLGSPAKAVLGGYLGIGHVGSTGFMGYHFLASVGALLLVLALSTAFVPLGAAILSPRLLRSSTAAERLFGEFSLWCLLIWLAASARQEAIEDTTWLSMRVFERYVFILAPLLFTWYFIQSKRMRPFLLICASALPAVALAVCALFNAPFLCRWSHASDAPSLTGISWIIMDVPHHRIVVIAALILTLCVAVLACIRLWSAWKIALGWSLVLIALNAGWYGFEWRKVRPITSRFGDFVTRLQSEKKPMGAVGMVADNIDIRVLWYTAFWLEGETFSVSVDSPAPWWGKRAMRNSSGFIDFGSREPEYIIAAETFPLPYPLAWQSKDPPVRVYRNPKYAGN